MKYTNPSGSRESYGENRSQGRRSTTDEWQQALSGGWQSERDFSSPEHDYHQREENDARRQPPRTRLSAENYRGRASNERREAGFGRTAAYEQDLGSYRGSGYGGADQGRRSTGSRRSGSFGPARPNPSASQVSSGPHQGRGPRGYRRSDARILDDVCEVLTIHPNIDPSNVEVQVRDCEVTLSGTVTSRVQRRLAEDLAESIAGVTHVQNNVRVSLEPGLVENATVPNVTAKH